MRCSEPASRGFAHPVVGGRPCGSGWRRRLPAGWSYLQGPGLQAPRNPLRSQARRRPAARPSSRRCARADWSFATTSTMTKHSPTFEEAIAADPGDPAPYRLKAAVTSIALLFEQGAITVDDYLGQARSNLPRWTPSGARGIAFQDSLRQALTLSEQRLERPSHRCRRALPGRRRLWFVAWSTATAEGRVLGSLGAARRASHEHERVLKLHPGRKDAGLIVGIYRYAVASLPAPMRLMARLAGFGGSRERGLRLVEEAARYPSDVQSNALFTLILLYNREARYDDALNVIGKLPAPISPQPLAVARGRQHRAAGRTLHGSEGVSRRRTRTAVARRTAAGRRGSSMEVRLWSHPRCAEGRARRRARASCRPGQRRARLGPWPRAQGAWQARQSRRQSCSCPRGVSACRTPCRQDRDSECSEEVKRLLK